MKKLILLLLFIPFVSFGQRNIVTQERSIEYYDGVVVSGSFDVQMTNSLEGKILIEADEKIIDDIITEIKGSTLIIRRTTNGVIGRKRFLYNNVNVQIPQKLLKEAIVSGSGKLYNNTNFETSNLKAVVSGSGELNLVLTANTIKIINSGSGKISLKGSAYKLIAECSGSGINKLKYFKAVNGDLKISGSGSIDVDCSENIDVNISGSGKVRYVQNPLVKVSTKISGSGSVRNISS